ncbi:MAG: class I SAM-dependent methyltransferase [Bacteroidota bacterium]
MSNEQIYNKKKPSYFQNSREDMLSYVPQDCKVLLDVGCGDGSFGKLVKSEMGAEVWGIELNHTFAELAKEKMDKVFQGELQNNIVLLPENKFDCISFNDVLEHFTQPDEILKNIKNLLSEKGVVIASIPNVRYIKNLKELLFDKDWRYREEGILDYTHYRFFTKKSIIRMFDECGYEIIKIEGINPEGRKPINSLIRLITFGLLSDTKFMQFACVAKIKKA